jgi:hypothetical protein
MERSVPAVSFPKLFKRIGVRRYAGPSLPHVGLAGLLVLSGILSSPFSTLVQDVTGTAAIASSVFSFACFCGALVTFIVGMIGKQTEPTIVPTEGKMIVAEGEIDNEDSAASPLLAQSAELQDTTPEGIGEKSETSGRLSENTGHSNRLSYPSGEPIGFHVLTSSAWLLTGFGRALVAMLVGYWLFAPTVPWVAMSGVVTFRGQRLTEGRVTLCEANGSRCYTTPISPDGNFAFQTSRRAGIQPGQYRVSVHPPPPRLEMDIEMGRITVHTGDYDQIPERYRDAATSGWMVDIQPRGGSVMDFEMQ